MARATPKHGRKQVTFSRVKNDPRFLQRIEQARSSLRAGQGVKLEEIPNKPKEMKIREYGTTDERR